MSSNATIYVGFWTNYSKGSGRGLTLTLTNRNGTILISALTIFIHLVGGQSWSIICFVTHRIRTSMRRRDGLYHQQQAVLRNNRSDINSIWQFTQIAWAWRRRSAKSFRKTLTLLIVGLLHFLAFGAAGVLSSHITTAGNQVLVARSSLCGALSGTLPIWGSERYIDSSIEDSRQYVRSCLNGGSQQSGECGVYKRAELNWTSSYVPCPFDDLCLGPVNSSLHLETCLIDSRDDMGINGDDKERIQWRRTATCSPITTTGYQRTGTSNMTYLSTTYEGRNSFNYTALYYGATYLDASGLLPLNLAVPLDPVLSNATYIYTNFYDIAMPSYTSTKYLWNTNAEIDDGDGSSFTAIAALSSPNTTLSLIFAAFSGAFEEPSDDLLFPAHIPVMLYNGSTYPEGVDTTEVNATYSLSFYGPDNTVSVLACIEQVQFCAPSLSVNISHGPDNTSEYCTPFQSLGEIFSANWDPLETPRQIKIANAFLYFLQSSSFSSIMSNTQLLAESLVDDRTSSAALAPDQWILESKNLFQIGLAVIQRVMLDTITGPPSPYSDNLPQNLFENDTDLDWLCRNQIIRRNDYLNFSTLNLWLVVGIGIGIIFLSLWLENLVDWLEGKGKWRMRAWWAEGTLQLQKAALEGRGIEGWEESFWDNVPVLESGRTFGSVESSRVVFPRWDVEEKRKEEPSEMQKSNGDERNALKVEFTQVDSVSSTRSVG